MKIKLSDHFTYKKLLKFVMPSIFVMILTSIYGVVDGFFISNYSGKTPFASINLVMPVVMILGGTGFMVGTGGTALVSKLLGQKDTVKANKYFSMLIIFSIFLGLFLTIIGITFMRPIVRLLGADESMLEYSIIYGRIVVGFTTFFILQSLFHSFLVVAEKGKLGFIVTLIAGVTNVILDALFIVVFDWGIVGAALATGIGQVMGGIIPFIYFVRKNNSLLQLVWAKPEFKVITKSCGNGFSELLTNVAHSLASMLYNMQLMQYLGQDGVSAYGVLMYVSFIFIAIEIGFTIGSAPIVGYNFGANNHQELKNVFRKSLIILTIMGIGLTCISYGSSFYLAKIFVGYDVKLFELTLHAFRLFSFSFLFTGIAIYSSGFFTALNNGIISAILSFLRAFVFQISFVFLFPLFLEVDGIWISMIGKEFCSFLLAIIFFFAYKKRYQYA